MCKYYITITFISSRSHEKYEVEQTIMIFLSTHQATNLCSEQSKKQKGFAGLNIILMWDQLNVARFSQLVPPAC